MEKLKFIREKEIGQEDGEKSFNDTLDVLKFTSEVKSRLKSDITSDLVLAKLEKKDREGITDMTGDAYLVKRLMYGIAGKSYEWKWNKKLDKYEKINLDKEKSKAIKELGDTLFDVIMLRVHMTAVLNRNVDENVLLNILGGKALEKEKLTIPIKEGAIPQILKPENEGKS